MRVLIVGVGYWGERLLQRLIKLVGTTDVWIRDTNSERAHELAEHYNVGHCHYSLLESITAPDAVVIATPISTHYKLTSECLLAGKHVLVEKPLAMTGAQAQELAALAQQRGLALKTDLTFLRDIRVALMRWPAREQLSLSWSGPPSGRSGHGILWTWGPHPISVMLQLHGGPPPVQVQGELAEDRARLVYTFLDRRVAAISLDWGSYAKSLGRHRWMECGLEQYDLGELPSPEPLTLVLEEFLALAQQRKPPVDDIGIQTVGVLEWTEQELSKSHS